MQKFKRFSLKELRKATNSFSHSNVIGMGGSGTVYFGRLVDGQSVAVKKLKKNGEGEHTYVNECRVLIGMDHNNLVRLIGFLVENDYDLASLYAGPKKKLALVYEFLSNGTLYDHLHGSSSVSTDQAPTIMYSWSGRLKVALDIAKGLEYLHVYAVPPVIHLDVKSRNILLDTDFTAKLSDFGLAISTTAEDDEVEELVCGTFGYLDPEFFQRSMCSTKTDVFSFGVVLLELLSGLKPVCTDENGTTTSLATMACNYIKDGKEEKILDQKMPQSNPQEMESARDIIFLAADCIELNARDRPSMTQVVHRLYTALMKCTPTLVTSTSQSSPVSTHS